MSLGFSIKKPTHGRTSFAIHKKIYRQGQKPLQPQVKDERLDAINRNFKSELLSFDQALIQVKVLIETFKKEAGISTSKNRAHIRDQILKANRKTFEKFWEEHYIGRDIVRPENVEHEFMKALKDIDPLPLASASRIELQNRVDSKYNNNQHKRYTGRINALLKFLGRPFILHRKKRPPMPVHFVNHEDLLKILENVRAPELRALYLTLFGTGVRLGEAFVFNSRSLKANGSIFIETQLTDKLEITGIKNSKDHHTVLLDICKEGYKAWASVPNKASWRKRCQHPLINAARKTFKETEKHISPHDLRHSYVIHLLSLGVSLDKVAKLIGDSIKTVEEYYSGYVMYDDEVNFVKNIINKKPA